MSLLPRDINTLTLAESRVDLFSFFLGSSRSICSLCRLVLTSAAFQKKEPKLRIHTWVFTYSEKTTPKLPSVVAVHTDQASFLVTVTVSPV